MSYVTGKVIKELRENKKLTQKQLAEELMVSDKAVSKWENNRGLPDISLLSSLSSALGVSVAELLVGEVITNQNLTGNMKKVRFYVCPVCGNIITAVGEGSFNCCGIMLPALEAEEADEENQINVEIVEQEYFVHMEHPMTKEHYITFVAYVTSDRTEVVKLYPQQNMECRFTRKGRGTIYAFCNKHGLFKVKL
ncbi:MAG TPA: helix-turn-helix domain-containing protein [Lachnospiraceae bacterium]|nr:helix-turn-helix domain-containing protein [Lachnospiraceae bacterium]